MAHVAAVVEEDMSTGIALRSPQLSGSASSAPGSSGSVQPSVPSGDPVVAVAGDSVVDRVGESAEMLSHGRVGAPAGGAPGQDMLAVLIGPNLDEASSPARSIHHVNIQPLAEDAEVEDPELLAPPVPRILRLNPHPVVAGEIMPRDLEANAPLPVAVGALQVDEHPAGEGPNFRQGGQGLEPNVQYRAFAEDNDNDESSESSYDSIYSVMHLSRHTPEGRRAWNNYNLTSRYVNRRPPYFHE